MALAKGKAEIVFYLLGGGGFLTMKVMMMMIMELMILFVRNKLINAFYIDSEYQPYLIAHPGSYCFI